MRMNFYARTRNDQNTKHQEKGKHSLNSFNTRDEYYHYLLLLLLLSNTTRSGLVQSLTLIGYISGFPNMAEASQFK